MPVIPELPVRAKPESILQRPMFMGSGFAATRRPGMTAKGQE